MTRIGDQEEVFELTIPMAEFGTSDERDLGKPLESVDHGIDQIIAGQIGGFRCDTVLHDTESGGSLAEGKYVVRSFGDNTLCFKVMRWGKAEGSGVYIAMDDAYSIEKYIRQHDRKLRESAPPLARQEGKTLSHLWYLVI